MYAIGNTIKTENGTSETLYTVELDSTDFGRHLATSNSLFRFLGVFINYNYSATSDIFKLSKFDVLK